MQLKTGQGCLENIMEDTYFGKIHSIKIREYNASAWFLLGVFVLC